MTEIEHRFEYITPTRESVRRIQAVREYCQILATMIERAVPEGKERAVAITNLEQVSMWANKGIVFHQLPESTSGSSS